ncbi:MAG TPA: right-handed parallel beta-helix repeat-containing protein [Acidimicrobiales bacterium]|nr:right-handed parallel beta-helix repeat-containing protein [Acidimicrobiales bacterium]
MKRIKQFIVMAVVALVGTATVSISPASAGPVSLACGSTHTGSSSGSPYNLSGGVTGCTNNGITLAGANYTFDLNGNDVSCVDGTPGDGVAIHITGTNITLIDSSTGNAGEVQFCDVGVLISGAPVRQAFNTVDGIDVHKNQGDQCLTTGGDGILMDVSDRNTVKNNVVTENGPYGGITILGGSSYNTVDNNDVNDNAWPVMCTPAATAFYYYETDGIRLEPNAKNNTISNNRVARSGLDGIAVFNPTVSQPDNPQNPQDPQNFNNFVTGNTLTDNGTTVPPSEPGYTFQEAREGDGIRVFDAAVANQINDNTVCGSQGNGIYAGVGGNFLNDNKSGTVAECGANDNHKAGTANGYWDLNDSDLPPGPGPCTNVWMGNTATHVNVTCTLL